MIEKRREKNRLQRIAADISRETLLGCFSV